jgi:hypothetical protein
MLNEISFAYSLLTLILVGWAWVDMAFTTRLKNRFFWWVLIFMFPVFGCLVYFQTRKRRKFSPKFFQASR